MSKRRRASSAASRGGPDDDYLEESTPEPSPAPSTSGRKRRKVDPSELCQQIYDSIRNHKKEDGTMLCDSFIRAPKRRQEPGYYEVVSNPIDLLRVQQKLKTDSYEDIEELSLDLELLVKNAQAFYPSDSEEHKDAITLWDLFQSQKAKVLEQAEDKGRLVLRVGRLSRRSAVDTDDNSESSNNQEEEFNQYEDLFTAVMTSTDSDNRVLNTAFQLLPSKKRYPEYYEVIDTPIDLKSIATKIQANVYSSLNEIEKDLLTMTRNACLFNEPGSQIYKDAKALKKVITSKKIEVEHGKYNPNSSLGGKSSERIRSKRIRGSQSLSAITAALREEDLDSDDEPEDNTGPNDGETPQWQLFDIIRNSVNTQGVPLAEPFWKLPSRRYYPDYYREIKQPISLNQIRARLRRGEYPNVQRIYNDMNLMFENAKKYNVHTSKIYKDAAKLQKSVQLKMSEWQDVEQDSESDCDSTDSRNRSVRRRSKSRPSLGATVNVSPLSTPTSTKSRVPHHKDNPLLRKKLVSLQKCLVEYTTADGRQPMLVFMEKPPKKFYPDYYQIISQPIDMQTIECNIRNERYATVDDMVGDCRLMFSNCRKYNEEGSVIHEDAMALERVLNEKLKELSQPERRMTYKARTFHKAIVDRDSSEPIRQHVRGGMGISRPRQKTQSPLDGKLRVLYDAIRDYREPKAQRQLALVFMKLPSKNDYPDYYDIIKQPVDMERIAQKLKSQLYEGVEELAADFILMFDNACKYNEPDSQIYKDALVLHRVCMQTKHSMREEPQSVPDVVQAVQSLLLSLFTTIYNHQDEEGRCFSDSFSELPEYDEVDGNKVRGISLDLIKRRLDRGLYRRLDCFQEDVFSCFERARRLSRTDGQAFEDSVELQTFFIKQRDELCKNGSVLSSPALNFTMDKLMANVEVTKQQKRALEEIAGAAENDDSAEASEPTSTPKGEGMTCNQQVYRVGDMVYIQPKDAGVDASIIYIERFWTNSEGQQMLYGNMFFRPHETFHVATRRFLEQEVFKTDTHIAVPLSQLQGKCYVMSVKDYFKLRPEGFLDRDIYVCESRYSTRFRNFKKIKIWPCSDGGVSLVPRVATLEPRRVMSVFKERVEKHKGELAELQLQEEIVEKEKPNVVAGPIGDEGHIYYEQYNTICSGVVKTGDCVYVAGDGGRQLIAQIQAMWETRDGKCYFRGPWMVPPNEVPHAPTRLFFPQEVFLSTQLDCSPLVSIVGKCAVLELPDFIKCRPTEIPETDVFVVESVYDELKRQIRKISLPMSAGMMSMGMKRFTHSSMVTPDEIYYFSNPINPPKVSASELAAAQPDIIKAQPAAVVHAPMDIDTANTMSVKVDMDVSSMDDSMDGAPASVASGDPPTPCATPIPANVISTPVATKKVNALKSTKGKTPGKKLVTGYILYSSEVRKGIAASNPDSSFGDISRIVGNEWRSLPATDKQIWEEKAARCNEESAAKFAAEQLENCPSPGQASMPQDIVYECCWDKCDFQFEDMIDCTEHIIAEHKGHVQTYFASLPQEKAEYQCQWRGCVRIKKQAPPFPHLQRLARHVRELHINKSNGRLIHLHDRSKNYIPSKRVVLPPPLPVQSTLAAAALSASNRNSPSPSVSSAPPQKALEPLFVTVPPRPQRVLHSDAYIKYIEGLQSENQNRTSICGWEKTLKATQETTPPVEESKLPTQWLAHGPGRHGSVLNALWALRDHMIKDALGIQREL